MQYLMKRILIIIWHVINIHLCNIHPCNHERVCIDLMFHIETTVVPQ